MEDTLFAMNNARIQCLAKGNDFFNHADEKYDFTDIYPDDFGSYFIGQEKDPGTQRCTIFRTDGKGKVVDLLNEIISLDMAREVVGWLREPGPYKSMDAIRKANAKAGEIYFDLERQTMHRPRYGTNVYGGRFFTCSILDKPYSGRLYQVYACRDNGELLMVDQAYGTNDGALQQIRHLIKYQKVF